MTLFVFQRSIFKNDRINNNLAFYLISSNAQKFKSLNDPPICPKLRNTVSCQANMNSHHKSMQSVPVETLFISSKINGN